MQILNHFNHKFIIFLYAKTKYHRTNKENAEIVLPETRYVE